MKNEHYGFPITAAAIDETAEKIEGYLTALKMDNKNKLRIRLSIEDILLKWRDRFGEDTVCTLRVRTQFGRPQISLELHGEEYNPLSCDEEEEEFGNWANRLLAEQGLYPIYSYANGTNQILLKLKKPRKNPIKSLLLSFAAAILVGFLGTALPADLKTILLENLITPVYDTFLGVLGTIAGPMVFLAVAWGIYGIGDISTLSRIGKRMLLRYLGISLLIVSFTAMVSSLLFDLKMAFHHGANGSQLWSIFHMLLDIFPDNMVSPFLDGNSMQIILIAVFVGSALLVLGKQTSAISIIVEQLNYVVHFLMELITKLVPWFIFIVVVQMFWTDSFEVITQAWLAIVVFLIAIAAVIGFTFLRVAFKNKVSPVLLLKKCSETFVVALTTASSTATFGTAMHCCERKLGISNYLTNFGLPLGLVFYAPSTAAYFLVTSFYVAGIYNVDISLAWILMAILVSVILAVASPPIPGGTLVCYTVLFQQLGISDEALVIAVALDVIFDFMATAVNMIMLEMELTQQASSAELLDYKILQKK